MSLDVFNAVVKGYSDRLFDLQLLAVQQGYWSGYYNRAKKPKSLDTLLKKLHRGRGKDTQRKEDITESDIEQFLRREHNRLLNTDK